MTPITVPVTTPTPPKIDTVADANVVRIGAGLRRIAPKSAPESVRDNGRVRVGAGLRHL